MLSGWFRPYKMRIISGDNRGKKLKAPKGLATRPVLGRVREALFNVIGDVAGIQVLDLFAGTGAIGIEALSRGAEFAVFVETGHIQCKLIKENLDMTGKSGRVMRFDAIKIIKKLSGKEKFGLVFADPPYDKGFSQKVLEEVAETDILAENGILALTVRRNEVFPDNMGGLTKIFDRSYGDSKILIYKIA